MARNDLISRPFYLLNLAYNSNSLSIHSGIRMVSIFFHHQAVKFAKKFAILAACFALHLPADASGATTKQLCTYFYDFNFHDPQLQKQDIRRAIKAMVFSNRIKSEKGEINHHILPKTLQFESENHWSPIIVEQLLNQNGVTPNTPLRLNIVYESQRTDNAIARQMMRALAQSDLIRVSAQAVKKSEFNAIRQKGNYQLIRAEQCVEKPDPAQFLWRFESRNPENNNGYTNEKVDKLLAKLRNKKLSTKKRDELMQEIVEILEQDIAILPLYEEQKTISPLSRD